MESNGTSIATLSTFLDQEGKRSRKDQLQSFLNHLFLGQWELAQSFSDLLCQNNRGDHDREFVLRTLLDVASNPYDQRFYANGLSSLEQLCWLALQEYERQRNGDQQDSDAADIALRKLDVEFRLMLVQECPDTAPSVISNVYQYYQKHHGTPVHIYSRQTAESLPHDVSDFLKKMLLEKPAIGHLLICALMPKKRTADNRECELLQGLYLSCVNSLLDGFEAAGDDKAQVCERIFQLLSFFNPDPYWNYLQIRQLFSRLVTLSKKENSGFTVGRVMESLMGRCRGYLLEEFGKLLYEVDVAGLGEEGGISSEEQKLTLHLLLGPDRDACWQRYFSASLRWNKHFLGLIMETCVSLVMAERFETLGKFLEPPDLRQLKPVVLLSGWTFCRSSSSARRLLDTLWSPATSLAHPALAAGCNRLAYQLSLIKWCVERARPLLENLDLPTSPATHDDRATRLLHGLETHSVLFVLHRSTRLAALDSQEVLQLLQNVARGNAGMEKRPKTVRFQDDRQHHEATEPVSTEQEHDICIYRSYCAVKNIMEAILFCYENSNLDLMNPISMKVVLKPNKLSKVFSSDVVSSSEGDESSSPGSKSCGEGLGQKSTVSSVGGASSFQEVYRRRVWQRIQQAREHLQHLYPLTYRVEVLENIFSLLFCRHNDIVDGALSVEGDSEDEAEGEDSKRSSTENLNMSVISEEDPDSERQAASHRELTSVEGSSVTDNLQEQPSSSSQTQTDSAFGSLGHGGQGQHFSRMDYDEPFPDRRSSNGDRRNSRGKTRFSDLGSSSLLQGLSQANYTCGFLANEYIVRDVLALLKEALLDLNAVRFKLQGQGPQNGGKGQDDSRPKHVPHRQMSVERPPGSVPPDHSPLQLQRQTSSGKVEYTTKSQLSPESQLGVGRPDDTIFNPELERVLSQTVGTSVTPDILHKRIAQLTQHVHEAQWRFQLVSHEQLPKQAGRVLEEMVVVTDDDGLVMSVRDDWMSSWGTSVASSENETRRTKSHQRPTTKSAQTSASVRSHCRLVQQSIVTRMLSSPETLLTMSLMRNNIPQAAQVIKLMKLNEKTQETAEVSFSESFHQTAKAIGSLTLAAREPRLVSSKKFSMQALKNAAAAGVATSSLANYVEDLLASPTIPPLPKPRPSKEQIQDPSLTQHFQVDTTTVILMDLACTTCHSWELCCNIFDIIRAKGKVGQQKSGNDTDSTPKSRSASDQTRRGSSSTGGNSGVKGCLGLFTQLDRLLQMGRADAEHWAATSWSDSSESLPLKTAASGSKGPVILLTSAHVPVSAQHSLVQHFRTVAPPITAAGLKQYEGVVREIQQALEHAHQALLVSSRLDRQESISIDEQHFAKSPARSSPPSISSSVSRSSSLGSSGSLSREATPGRPEPPILHTKMKQLIAAMEKFVPHGGLYLLLTGFTGCSDSSGMRNYLLSMYEHVKELAFIVAECESKVTDTLILPKNYFCVLQEGPVDILGRLIFIKRIPPGKLEKMANRLSLNLTHIIVQSCCPQIPSKHLPAAPADVSQGVEKVGLRCIYNGGSFIAQDADSGAADPEVLVRTILIDTITAMHENAIRYNGKGVFKEVCGQEFVKSESFARMTASVRELQGVDLSLLDSREKRLCFFANLLNLMTIHYHMHNVKRLVEAEKSRPDVRVGEAPQWRLCGLQGDHLIDMVTHLGAFCYRVGQLGVLSLFDLKYVLLQHGRNLSSVWKVLLSSGMHKLAAEDPMSIHMPPAEPRLMFVVSDGCQSSPPITVLEPDSLSFQLETAAQNYLQQTVIVEADARKITLPYLLTSLSLDPVGGGQSQCQTPYDNLLNFVSINAATVQTEQLEQVISGSGEDKEAKKAAQFEVCLSPFVSEFTYIFSMQDLVTTTPPSYRRSQPQTIPQFPGAPHLSVLSQSVVGLATPGSIVLSEQLFTGSSGTGLENNMSIAEPASYQLTPLTLDYVRETSALVATLLTLTCSDELEGLEAQFTDDPFPASSFPRNRTASDISVVDIRSYRYHRLVDDFPILMRHLLAYIIPLAGADNPEISHSGEPILKFVTNNINEDVKLCLFSLHDSLQFLDMLQKMVARLSRRRQWGALIPVMRSIPEVVMKKYPHLQLLQDFILSCWAREIGVTVSKTQPFIGGVPGLQSSVVKKAITSLYQLRKVYCGDVQARVSLVVCDALPVDFALDLMNLCLSQKLEPGLQSAVEAKHHYLSVYSRISAAIKTLQIRLAMQSSEETIPGSTGTSTPQSSKEYQKLLMQYSDWRYTAQMSREDPREVLSVLIKAGDFAVTRDWAKLYQLPRDMVLEMEVWHVMSLLSHSASDLLPAYETLEDVRKVRQEDCLQVCQTLLERLEDHHKVKFLTSYMLQHIPSILTPDELEDLRLRRIGAKALLCIPKVMRSEYTHLRSCPHLILEQLLMNMKGELAGRVFAEIKDDFQEIKEIKLKVAQDQFDTLLANYARRALEVTVAQTTDSRPGTLELPTRSESSGSGSSSRTEDDLRSAPPLHRVATESVIVRKRNMDSMTPRLGTTPPGGGASSVPGRRNSVLSIHQVPLVSTRPATSSKFIMPVVPPAEDQWVPDSSATMCMVCKLERFSMFNRRHHCRRCGRVVCAGCSNKRSQVRGVSARTCDECYEQLFGPRESRAKDEQEVYSQRMKESLSGASPNPSSLGYSSSPSRFLSNDFVGRPRTLSSAIHHDVHDWKLKMDEGFNSCVRDEFYYEQAPSVTLCMSILEHHSNSHASGQLILTMCDDLSSFLQPLAPGMPNLEVDFSLIISIIRELLFRAKVIFLKSGDASMTAQCDGYQARVDLLKILLEDNYPDLPTLQELTKMDTARRLRDRLIRDERLHLALEVCLKCGVDAAGVWLARGRACLQIGDFAAARDKFAHILKAPKDKNQSASSSRLLMEIIDLLEALPPSGVTEIQTLLTDPISLNKLITSLITPALQEETSVESVVYQECVYYLRTYGTYTDHLKFLLRNGYWNKALRFFIDKRCSPDVFVEALLMPALQAGELTRLTEQLLMHDSSLEQWMPHLTASCRHLLKQRRYNILYNVQLLMKDFLRAAMTCITHFYQHGAQTYLNLAGRLEFLFVAQEHMQAYLDPQRWGSVRHPLVTPATHTSPPVSGSPRTQGGEGAGEQACAQLSMSKEDVVKHQHTIALQIEVTKYLEHCLTNNMGEAAAQTTQYVLEARVPTLFGSPEQRKDLVKMILLSGGSLKDAFDLSLKIFYECKLKPVAVLKKAVCEQLRLKRHKDMMDLLNMADQRRVLDDEDWDEVVSTALLEITEKQLEAREEMEALIKMIRKEHNKINALIMSGKLRSAYLTAAKSNRAQDITRIMAAAERMGQAAVRNICKKWLEQQNKRDADSGSIQ